MHKCMPDSKTIRTDHFSYEILLAAADQQLLADDAMVAQQINEAMESAYGKTVEAMRYRCSATREFWNGPVTNNKTLQACRLNPRKELGKTYNGISKLSTYPSRPFNCCSRLAGVDLKQNVLITFGKFNTLIVAPMYHSYWSSYFRSCIAADPKLGDFISIPASRIIYPRSNGSKRVSHTDKTFVLKNQNAKPVVLWTLLNYRQDGLGITDDKPVNRKNWLRSTLSWLRALHHKPPVDMKFFTDCNLEVFLSYSLLFPIILKSEFDNFDDALHYLRYIRERGRNSFSGTSSFFSVRANSIWDDSWKLQIDRKRPLTKKNLRFVIFLKLHPGYESIVLKSIKKELCSVLNPRSSKDIDCRICQRPFYWDAIVAVSTRKIRVFVDYLTQIIQTGRIGNYLSKDNKFKNTLKNAIERVTVVPQWAIEDYPLHKQPKGALLKSAKQSERSSVAISESFSEMLNTVVGGYANWGGEKGLGIASRRLYNSKLVLDWLACHISQIQNLWIQKHLPGEMTFTLMNEMLEKIILPTMKDMGQILNEWIENSHKIDQESFDEYWGNLAELEDTINRLKEHAQCVRAEFHERTEGLQALTENEPHILLGERSGVTDMFHAAAAVLLRRYCSQWDFTGHKIFKQNIWKGIVAASNTASDWIVFPGIQLLQLPLELKLGTHCRLVPLAHEGAHQIVREAYKSNEVAAGELKKWWYRICNSALKMSILLSKRIKKELNKHHDLDLIEVEFDRVNRTINDWEKELPNSEFVADMLYFLSAGPAAIRSLYELIYSGECNYLEEHPPMWLRVIWGCGFFSKLGIDLNRDPWLVEKSKNMRLDNAVRALAIKAGEPVDLLCDLINQQFQCKTKNELSDLIDIIGKQEMREDGVSLRGDAILNHHVFLISALYANDNQYLNELIDWCRKYSEPEFFFYPISKKRRFIKKQVDAINKKCRVIAANLLYNEQIVLNANPRYIAAASVHPLLRRPFYPGGRVIHSIFYGTDWDDKMPRAS